MAKPFLFIISFILVSFIVGTSFAQPSSPGQAQPANCGGEKLGCQFTTLYSDQATKFKCTAAPGQKPDATVSVSKISDPSIKVKLNGNQEITQGYTFDKIQDFLNHTFSVYAPTGYDYPNAYPTSGSVDIDFSGVTGGPSGDVVCSPAN